MNNKNGIVEINYGNSINELFFKRIRSIIKKLYFSQKEFILLRVKFSTEF